MNLLHIRDKLQKPAENYIRKIREIDWSYLCLQQFDKFWMWSAKKTGNGINVNQMKIALKNSWNQIKWTYYWSILPTWNHSVLWSWDWEWKSTKLSEL